MGCASALIPTTSSSFRPILSPPFVPANVSQDSVPLKSKIYFPCGVVPEQTALAKSQPVIEALVRVVADPNADLLIFRLEADPGDGLRLYALQAQTACPGCRQQALAYLRPVPLAERLSQVNTT